MKMTKEEFYEVYVEEYGEDEIEEVYQEYLYEESYLEDLEWRNS